MIRDLEPNYKAEQFSLMLNSMICENSPAMRYAGKPLSARSRILKAADPRAARKFIFREKTRNKGEITVKFTKRTHLEPSKKSMIY